MSRHDQRAGRSGRLARSAERDRLEIASVARVPATFRRGAGIPQLSIWAHRPACYPHPLWTTPRRRHVMVNAWFRVSFDFAVLAWRRRHTRQAVEDPLGSTADWLRMRAHEALSVVSRAV